MAVTETTRVKTMVLSGNPVVSIVHSNNYTSGNNLQAGHRLVFTDKAAAGEYFTVSLLNGAYELTFVAAASPDDSGKQFPSGAGAADASYLASVKTWVEKNFIIASYYDVSVVASVELYLMAKEYGSEYNVEFIDNDFSATYAGLGNGQIVELKDNYAVHGKLKVYEDPNWVEVSEDRIVPDNTGNAQFDWSEIIDTYLKNLKSGSLHLQFPDSGSNSFIKEQKDLIRRFAYSFAEFYGLPYEPESLKVESDAWYAIEGGLSKLLLSFLNANSSNFYYRLVEKKHWLTWKNSTKTVHVNQFDRMFYLNLYSSTSIKLYVTVYFADGTFTSAVVNTLSSTGQYRVYEVATSPWHIINHFTSSIPSGSYISKYEVSLQNSVGDTITEKHTINIDYSEHENYRVFMYKNSFGVFETIYTTGIGIKNTSYKKVEIQQILEFDFTNINFEDNLVQVFEAETQTVNTGFFKTINELERFRDFLITETLYEIVDGFLVPCRLLTDKARFREDNFYNYALEFEYKRSYESEYYSVDDFSALTPKSTFSDAGEALFIDIGSAKFDK